MNKVINALLWFARFLHKGRVAYPKIYLVFDDPDEYYKFEHHCAHELGRELMMDRSINFANGIFDGEIKMYGFNIKVVKPKRPEPQYRMPPGGEWYGY